jgi:hypothetical protein
MNAKTVKLIAIQTGCLLVSVRGKQNGEAIHVHLFFSYLEMITPLVLAFERNLTMGNGFYKRFSVLPYNENTEFFSC